MGRRQGDDETAIVWTATGLERQIFLDQTGRRAAVVRAAGVIAALACAAWLAALATGAVGFFNLPLPPGSIGVLARGPEHAIHVAEHGDRRRQIETAATRSGRA